MALGKPPHSVSWPISFRRLARNPYWWRQTPSAPPPLNRPSCGRNVPGWISLKDSRDAMRAARARQVERVLIDTAGRLHTKTHLMEELKKMRRVLEREMPGAPHDIWLVLDATTGQNGIAQVQQFHDSLGLTGLVLTKLDGTAKGGIVINIADQFHVPIRYIGIGEGLDDLRPFDAADFAAALLET